MYVWYLPEFLLMIAEEDEDSIQEHDIEAIPSKLPGKVIKLKIDEVRPYLDEDALAALHSTSKYLFVRNI
jgi:predicted transcriptional regulator